jgi:hypothetical protein
MLLPLLQPLGMGGGSALAASVRALVDRETDIIEQALGGPIQADTVMLTIATPGATPYFRKNDITRMLLRLGELVTLDSTAVGSPVTVQGESFKVWKRAKVGDGALTHLFLEKA